MKAKTPTVEKEHTTADIMSSIESTEEKFEKETSLQI